MKKFAILIITIVFAQSLMYSQTFQEVTTPYKYVHDIKFLKNNLLFVAGDSIPIDIYAYSSFIPYIGSGFYLSQDMGNNFTGPYLDGKTVFDIYQSQLNNSTFFATGYGFTRGGIYQSSDGGKTWDNSALHENVKIYQKISSTIEDGNEIFLVTSPNTSEGVSYTTDNFQTLTSDTLFNTQVYDLKIAYNLKTLFFATDNSTFGHVAHLNKGKIVKDETGLEGLRVLCVQPSNKVPGYIYCGADSVTAKKASIGKGIFYSIDSGRTWKPLMAQGYRVFEIQEHPSNNNFMAAACGELGVGVSSNFGEWFETFSDGLPQGADVRKVAIPDLQATGEGIQIYASLLNGGVYKSKYITSSVEEKSETGSLSISNIFPNPVTDNFTLKIDSPKGNSLRIIISDLLGKTVFFDTFENANVGTNVITFSDLNLLPGSYFVTVTDNYSQVTKSITIIK